MSTEDVINLGMNNVNISFYCCKCKSHLSSTHKDAGSGGVARCKKISLVELISFVCSLSYT